MPDHLNDWTGGRVDQGFWWKTEIDQHGNDCSHIMLGNFAKEVSKSLLSMTQALLNDGHSVIIDEVCLDQETAQNWQKVLYEFNVFYVGITADLTTLERREKARDTRMIGSARAQAKLVHEVGFKYDLMIDTSDKSVDECARMIITKY
jgi:chloramphenicol 3-O-phosphotransferase